MDDLFCTGDIQTINYCLEVYRQYLDNKEFDPFLWNAIEIKLTLKSLQPELEDFYKNLEKLFIQLFKFMTYNGIFTKDPDKLKTYFFENSKKTIY